jgi:hypothetical protein
MNWTKTLPTKEGFYWVARQKQEKHIPAIVKLRINKYVENIDGTPALYVIVDGEVFPLEDYIGTHYWSDEPIAQPEWHPDFDKFETGN